VWIFIVQHITAAAWNLQAAVWSYTTRHQAAAACAVEALNRGGSNGRRHDHQATADAGGAQRPRLEHRMVPLRYFRLQPHAPMLPRQASWMSSSGGLLCLQALHWLAAAATRPCGYGSKQLAPTPGGAPPYWMRPTPKPSAAVPGLLVAATWPVPVLMGRPPSGRHKAACGSRWASWLAAGAAGAGAAGAGHEANSRGSRWVPWLSVQSRGSRCKPWNTMDHHQEQVATAHDTV
jgi:hypothetical protein